MSSLADRYPVNFHIRASFIYLIDQNGKNIGKVHLNDAISMAREAGLDVVHHLLIRQKNFLLQHILALMILRQRLTS